MKQVIHNVFNEIYSSTKNDFKITGMPSCFIQIDFNTKGFFPGKVYVFCGSHLSYKTSLLLNISYNLGIEFPYFVIYFSLDSNAETLTKRMLFAACNCNLNVFPYDFPDTPDFAGMKRLFSVGERLKKSNLKFVCNSILTLDDIENECKDVKGKGVIVIDYFQMLSYGKKPSVVLKQLKQIAVRFNVAVLLIYETNFKSYVNKSFFLRNGVDSIFLIRKERSYEVNFEKNDIEQKCHVFFEILKQKDGPSAKFELSFDENSMKFYDEEIDFFESREFEDVLMC